ncbi:hypothetical protein Raf01_90120 [Rugosimonospora africana]|uniref:Uncharacterized protein n=1 Tax=Rugosimonospora africana TaxID=556532 RepID=A0A8J3R3Q8_9ACTN|nr:hypothetical protein Raf01_90120 [Rugosimonospora africana]
MGMAPRVPVACHGNASNRTPVQRYRGEEILNNLRGWAWR